MPLFCLRDGMDGVEKETGGADVAALAKVNSKTVILWWTR
jgi:hypothetical protein